MNKELTDEQIDNELPLGMAPYLTLCGPTESRGAILESETAITCGIPSQPLHFWLRAGKALSDYCTPTNPATHPAPPPKTTPTTKAPE